MKFNKEQNSRINKFIEQNCYIKIQGLYIEF